MTHRQLRLILGVALAAITLPARADDLADRFRDPPQSARPRVWWHWMNGNVTKDGIAKDIAWMKAVGIGGLQNFDVNLQTPQIVDHRLVYMTPEWKDAFRFAATEADKNGLEFAIASSPGWSETGGPWVKPEDGLKKLVWSKADLPAGPHVRAKLPQPPMITGPFQSIAKQPGLDDLASGTKPATPPQWYGDIITLAIPVTNAAISAPQVSIDGAPATLGSEGIAVPRGKNLVYSFATPQTVRSASVLINHASLMFGGAIVDPVLEASDDGQAWHKVADLPAADVPTTASFAPVTAKMFRLALHPRTMQPSNMMTPAPGVVAIDLFSMGLGGPQAPWDVHTFTLSSEPAVDRFETKAGYALSMDYFALGQPGDEVAAAKPGAVIDVSRFVKPDGSLDWAAPALPKGQHWRVIRLGASLLGTTNHPAPAEATGLEVDKFDGAAVQRYIDHYLGMYRDAAGSDLIGQHGVRALLNDSIEVGAANWTPAMLAQFKARRGYDATPWLPALTGMVIESRAASDRFLYDWRRTLADLMASEHYGTIAKAAHAAGLTLYGEALEDKRPSLGDDMAMRTHTDIPMSALWTYPQGAEPNPSYLADMKGASSVAHVYGQNLAAAESMTSALTYWADSPRTLKHVIDTEFVSGINRPVVHTSVHQPTDDKLPGLSLLIFGQYFNRHEAWAPLAKAWVDYISRNAMMLQNGRNVADVAFFYGEEAPLTGLYGLHPVADAPTTHAYDFVNFDALNTALSNDGKEIVSVGGARYRALYLGGSSAHMTLAALRRVAALAEGGALVIGTAPVDSPSQADAGSAEWHDLVARLWPAGGDATVGKGRVIASHDVEAALATAGVAHDFAMTGDQAPKPAEVPFVHRRWDGGDSWFLVNKRQTPVTFEAHFRITGKFPDLWHAETGSREMVAARIFENETVVPLTLAGEESVHVVFANSSEPNIAEFSDRTPPSVKLASLDGPWTVAFEPGRGAPASATLPALAPLDQNPDPAIRYFSGVATYTRDFVAPKGRKTRLPLWLDLGDVREMAEVSLNGQVVGTVWHAPYRVEIAAAVHRGVNHLSVRVANLWVNRLIGDAQKDATKVTWTSMPTYRPDAPLRPSGLIGPVTIEGLR